MNPRIPATNRVSADGKGQRVGANQHNKSCDSQPANSRNILKKMRREIHFLQGRDRLPEGIFPHTYDDGHH